LKWNEKPFLLHFNASYSWSAGRNAVPQCWQFAIHRSIRLHLSSNKHKEKGIVRKMSILSIAASQTNNREVGVQTRKIAQT
jgi:hypothetical protein